MRTVRTDHQADPTSPRAQVDVAPDEEASVERRPVDRIAASFPVSSTKIGPSSGGGGAGAVASEAREDPRHSRPCLSPRYYHERLCPIVPRTSMSPLQAMPQRRAPIAHRVGIGDGVQYNGTIVGVRGGDEIW